MQHIWFGKGLFQTGPIDLGILKQYCVNTCMEMKPFTVGLLIPLYCINSYQHIIILFFLSDFIRSFCTGQEPPLQWQEEKLNKVFTNQVAELPPPSDTRTLKSVIGLFSRYSKWIPNFSAKIKPLTRNKVFPLQAEVLQSFDILKKDIQDSVVCSIDERKLFARKRLNLSVGCEKMVKKQKDGNISQKTANKCMLL